jgi:hypothetical protein
MAFMILSSWTPETTIGVREALGFITSTSAVFAIFVLVLFDKPTPPKSHR